VGGRHRCCPPFFGTMPFSKSSQRPLGAILGGQSALSLRSLRSLRMDQRGVDTAACEDRATGVSESRQKIAAGFLTAHQP
jgi:hypothetical protein